MTTLRTAAQLALEALNSIDVGYRSPSGTPLEASFDEGKCEAAITALRAALAQQDEPVEPVAWSGYDLDGMVEAFSRVIEAHHSSKHPFHNPIDMDARMALRILRGFIPAMKAYAAPPQQAEPVEPVAWRTFDGEGGYDYRTYADNENYAAEWAQRNPRHVGWVEPLYTAPPRCPNCASLEAQNNELDRKLAELERAHGIIESEIKVDSHQTLDDAMQQPRAMAQAYENGYKAGVAAEREECAKVCDFHVARLSAIDEPRPALAVGICAAAIRARGNT